MKQPEYTAWADASRSTEEDHGDERRDERLLSTMLKDLTAANFLARQLRLVVQKVFSGVHDLYHTGIINAWWISPVGDSAHGSGEAVALQRRVAQLEKILQAITGPDTVDCQVPTSSMSSHSVSVFDNEVGYTITDSLIEQEQKQQVYMNFPRGWTSGMKDIYLGLYACRASGRWVSDLELSSWTEIPVEEVQQCLQWLVQARKVHGVGDGSLWKCA